MPISCWRMYKLHSNLFKILILQDLSEDNLQCRFCIQKRSAGVKNCKRKSKNSFLAKQKIRSRENRKNKRRLIT